MYIYIFIPALSLSVNLMGKVGTRPGKKKNTCCIVYTHYYFFPPGKRSVFLSSGEIPGDCVCFLLIKYLWQERQFYVSVGCFLLIVVLKEKCFQYVLNNTGIFNASSYFSGE